MQILLYNRLNTEPVQRQFDKTLRYLEQGDFRSADVRKMKTHGYYRARLDDANRLLFKIGNYEGKKYLFLLEVILNHDYDKSRFLRGAAVQEEKLKPLHDAKELDGEEGVMELSYLNPNSQRFSIVDKIITFDETQSEILQHQPPMLLLGAAGSGKTVLALEKIRSVEGKVLYVTLSGYLAAKAKLHYENYHEPVEGQTVLFCALDDYLRKVLHPKGREATYSHFKAWFERIRSTVRIRDVHKLFEEIRGVLTGTADDKPYLSKEEYEALGIRQSVFINGDKEQVYAIFQRYLTWLKTEDLYDPNIAAQTAQALVQSNFDLVVVDEVQDMTNVQLSLILKSLKNQSQFIICGDANQVVHPNFFSWTSVKRLLHQKGLSRDVVRLLPSNHRNKEGIVKFTNRLLALKHVRFGSIDKESSSIANMKADPEADKEVVRFFEATQDVIKEVKKGLELSSHTAIIVLREEDKPAVRKHFDTPMIFTVHEAKGLEFPVVVLWDFLSNSSEQFDGICEGVMPRDLNGTLQYSRPKNKEDRSLQAYLFYINSLYVAMTRALDYLYFVESKPKHRLLTLLGVRNLNKTFPKAMFPISTLLEWQQEANRLELSGRKEQADAIKAKFGNHETPPWTVTTYQDYLDLRHKFWSNLAASDKPSFNLREKNRYFEHTLFYNDLHDFTVLFGNKYNRAVRMNIEIPQFLKKLTAPYKGDNPQRIENLVKKYGPNFRNEIGLTPLMLAALAGAANIAKYLLKLGANPKLTDNWGRTAFELAIVSAYRNEKYAKEKFAAIVNIVHPQYLHVKRDNSMMSIDYGSLNFFIASIIIALQREFFFTKASQPHTALQVDDFCKILNLLPDEALPANQKKREYVIAFLAKSDFMSHKNPFIVRLRKGHYTLVLTDKLHVYDDWVELRHLFNLPVVGVMKTEPGLVAFMTDLKNLVDNMRPYIEQMVEDMIIEEEGGTSLHYPDRDLQDWPA